ncbi:DUF4178 domain-containing protein [Ruegeria sp. R14_0]|uniref:DUF4178 domain-containing protein n=1 Tax=Ruegeria sp. R14_0 TaxID=2821100 RepID=UPI001ADCE41D|nr:DUF4178 domain-containing protein [Ruegeria sp. R14_0]MBO9446877.1 DUF4178 domain-containing protein [Ruegeria sp. R14_0]
MDCLNCPNCGSENPKLLQQLKVATCLSCGTTLMINDEHVQLAGDQGIMHDAPMLFGLGDTVTLGRTSVRILGHARYSYGRGFWDEFCGADDAGATYWISVDEGDVVMQTRLHGQDVPKSPPPFRPGETLDFDAATFTVTEVETAECIALRGQFDEALQVGERHDFVNASAGDEALLSGEFWADSALWFYGRWYDPFDIKVERNA